MSDAIETGTRVLARIFKANASKLVTYERTGLGTVDVLATCGPKLLKVVNDVGDLIVVRTDLSIVVTADDLVIAGQVIEPKKGDYVYLTQGAEIQKYQVMPYHNEREWQWTDPFKVQRRVHTKIVNTQVVSP